MAEEDQSSAGGGESMSMSAAAAKVFNTTELLEGILLWVSPQELLFSQRVCKQWKFVIEGSINIKKALFLEIGESSVPSPGRCALESAITYHDDMKVFRIFDPDNPEDLGRMVEPVATCGVQLNFLLMPLIIETKPFPDELHRYIRSTMIVWDLKPHLLFSHESASCRHMYLTQPPINIRIFDVDFCSLWAMEPRHPRPHRDPRNFCNVRTLGELIDVVKEKLEGEERLKIMKCLRIMVGVGPEEVKTWVDEYGGK